MDNKIQNIIQQRIGYLKTRKEDTLRDYAKYSKDKEIQAVLANLNLVYSDEIATLNEISAALQPSTLPLIECPDIEPLIKKFLPNHFELSTFKPKEILRLEAAFQQGAQVMFHELKNRGESVPLIDKGDQEETFTELCEEGQNLIWLLLPAQKYQGNKDAGRLWEILETIKIKNNDTNSR